MKEKKSLSNLFEEHWIDYTSEIVRMYLNRFSFNEKDKRELFAFITYLAQSHWIHGAKHQKEELQDDND